MTKYKEFCGEYEKYRERLPKASGTISFTLEQSIRFKFNNLNYNSKPKEIWEAIKLEFEGRIRLDGRRGMLRLACLVQTRAVPINNGVDVGAVENLK